MYIILVALIPSIVLIILIYGGIIESITNPMTLEEMLDETFEKYQEYQRKIFHEAYKSQMEEINRL